MQFFRVSSYWLVAAGFVILGNAQSAPTTHDRPWSSPFEQQIQTQNRSLLTPKFTVDPNKAYSLAKLVDLAEQHNPDTRIAWERAKAQAAALGVAKSEWYPVIGALASGEADRFGLLIDESYIRQTTTTSQLALTLTYVILDFGRTPHIQQDAAQLLATDFGFNDIHRKVIYQVSRRITGS